MAHMQQRNRRKWTEPQTDQFSISKNFQLLPALTSRQKRREFQKGWESWSFQKLNWGTIIFMTLSNFLLSEERITDGHIW